jgi:hypothetical protein
LINNTQIYYNYLDQVLINSKYKIDLLGKGIDVLLRKFPEISEWRNSARILTNYIVDTDPYNRLQKAQIALF